MYRGLIQAAAALIPAVLGAHPPVMLLQPSSSRQHWGTIRYDEIRVPVQLGVMSRCPDALLCENVFNHVLESVAEKVNMSLIYVAKLDPKEPAFGVRCMHGSEECAGNVQQLCVAKHEPFPLWWEFIQCQNYEGREHIGEANVALKCANAAGFDWQESKAGLCAGLDGNGKGPEGISLLRESVSLSQTLGIEKSCTILIGGREVCIHDGTWKQCENGHTVNDFVRQINDEYDKLNET